MVSDDHAGIKRAVRELLPEAELFLGPHKLTDIYET